MTLESERDPTPPRARGRIRGAWSLLGPGVLLAATSIGASHLVLVPRAGMLFGPALLWLVLAAHLFKYPAFEFGPRYALATGESLLAGYARVPGPRHWALWIFAVFTALQGVGVAVAVTSITAAVLTVSLGTLSFATWAGIVITVAALLLLLGKLPALETVSKLMMATLAAITVVAFFARPPAPAAWTHLVRPALPAGSIVLAAAIVGWLPTGIDVSIWHSLWALEARSRWCDDAPKADARAVSLRRGLLDMRFGYGLSFFLAVFFLFLGAQVPASSPTLAHADGPRVAVALGEAYTHVLGGWARPAFLLAGFFAMFSTTYVVLDGFPRALAESAHLIARARGIALRPKRVYWGLVAVVWASVSLLLWGLGAKPVLLVTIAATLSLVVSPLYAALNHYCVTHHVTDAAMRPSRALRWLSLAGVAFVASTVALLLYVRATHG